MENYTSNEQNIPRGIYGQMDSDEMNNIKEIYTYNQNIPPSDQKYLDYSIKELRTEIKRMFDNLNDVHQKTNEYINNKNINSNQYRKNSNYLSVDKIRRNDMNDNRDKRNLKYNEYSYKYRNMQPSSRNMYSGNSNNDNRYNNNIIAYNNYNYYNNNNDYTGNTFRNANASNNQILRYNNFKTKIIPKSNNVVKLFEEIPKNANRYVPNIKNMEKSKTITNFYSSKSNPRYQNRTNKSGKNFSYDNEIDSENQEVPINNIMEEYTLLQNKLEDTNGKLRIKNLQLNNYISEIQKRDEYIQRLKDEINNGPKARVFTERDRENIIKRNRDLVEENEKLNLQIKNMMENNKKMVQDKIRNMANNNQSEENNRVIAFLKEECDKKNMDNINLTKNLENMKKEFNIIMNNNKILEENKKGFKKIVTEKNKLEKENADLKLKLRNYSSANIFHKKTIEDKENVFNSNNENKKLKKENENMNKKINE